MRRLRFPIAAMMVGITFLALGLAALRTGTFASFKAVYLVTLLALLIAVIAARYRPDVAGAFWFGFAVFGWGYFLVGVAHWRDWNVHWDVIAISGQVDYIQIRANPVLPTESFIRQLAEDRAGPEPAPVVGASRCRPRSSRPTWPPSPATRRPWRASPRPATCCSSGCSVRSEA